METDERIINAGQELFFKYGIRSVTMDDIAKHLGISKKTIYQFFADKNELVKCLCDSSLGKHQCKFEELSNTSKDAIDEILQLMKYVGEMFNRINPSVFYDMKKYHPAAWSKFKEFTDKKMISLVEANINLGISQGLYRPDVNPKVLAKLRMAQVDIAMDPEIFPPGEYSLPEVQVAILEHFVYGILTIKGYKLINKYKHIIEDEE